MSKRIFEETNVLIIDDDPKSLDVVLMMLKHHHAQVSVASNGQEGLKVARETTPDFIITDLSMPLLSGWDLIQELKSDEQLQDIPVIALTAHAMVGDREKTIQAGFQGYMTKPLNPYSFIQELVSFLMQTPQFSHLDIP